MKKKHYIVVPGDGVPCPGCSRPMQIREHDAIRQKHLNQPYYFTRWYYCLNPKCRVTTHMEERYKVKKPVVWGDTWPELDLKSHELK